MGSKVDLWAVDRHGGTPENRTKDLKWGVHYNVGKILNAEPWGSLSELGGKPHEIPDVYRVRSPITYAHTCTTPTLLVQGEADYRCPAGQSEQFYAHLKANGRITEIVRLPEMAHVASINGPIVMQKVQNDELLGWMNKYVLGKA